MSARRTVLLVLLALATLPYFVGLGTSSLWDANEAFYAQTPREMLAASDLITPSFNFQLRFNKPVLPYWTVAAFYKVFGISERSERLPIALGAIVLVGVAFGLGRLISSTALQHAQGAPSLSRGGSRESGIGNRDGTSRSRRRPPPQRRLRRLRPRLRKRCDKRSRRSIRPAQDQTPAFDQLRPSRVHRGTRRIRMRSCVACRR